MEGLSVEALDEFAMLEGVGRTARRELLAAAVLLEHAARDVIIEQGKRRACMFLVLDGELSVHLDDPDNDPVATIGAGETVGELSMLDGSVASAYVTAHTSARLLQISEDDFWSLTNVSHAFAVNLLLKLASRLRANNAQVSKNVEKRRLYERAAMFDGLTGIHNRRWLDETLHRMVDRCARGGGELSLALIDIDHFKSFNDTYGHAAGDHVLTVVAAALAANLRPTDLVARFGGEEFVIILPDTELTSAALAAERVRAAIEREVLTTPEGVALPSVTISMG
ncbi:MAG TPA: GGDEF domain-containing protein, partial [Polyangiaceae bacterium]|nr:GGDEF domain-containing protein [Polyangiaceae bacterium]